MATTEIKWSADFDGVYIAKQQTTLLSGWWAGQADNATAAVQEICEDFFTSEVWQEWVGMDDNDWMIQVEIYEPEAISGTYEVGLERTVKASARKLSAKSVAA